MKLWNKLFHTPSSFTIYKYASILRIFKHFSFTKWKINVYRIHRAFYIFQLEYISQKSPFLCDNSNLWSCASTKLFWNIFGNIYTSNGDLLDTPSVFLTKQWSIPKTYNWWPEPWTSSHQTKNNKWKQANKKQKG